MAKCPHCGSLECRRYYANTIISSTGYLLGNLSGHFINIPLQRFGIRPHIEYALGEAGKWVGNAMFDQLVCKKCGKTFPKPEGWDDDNDLL